MYIVCVCIYIYIYVQLSENRRVAAAVLGHAPPRLLLHSCHILPFQPIMRNTDFPPEPAKTAKHRPKSISEGGRIWQVCSGLLVWFSQVYKMLLLRVCCFR